MTTTPPTPPPPWSPAAAAVARRPEDQVRVAYQRRHETDYVFTGPALNVFLTVVTCGIFGFYLLYKLLERTREHNRRRLELLEGATALAWRRASDQGLADELRPAFERIGLHLEPLRRMARDFRDPAAWLGIAIVVSLLSGLGVVVFMVVFSLLDDDLHRHDVNEGAVEAELAAVYGRLGHSVPTPDPGRVHGRHNDAARIVVTLLTCGIYGLWWLYDMQVEPNEHFPINWAWEDALATAVQALAPTTP